MLFTFPSRYLFTIGRIGVLRLGGWSPHIQAGFHVPRPTLTDNHFTYTRLSRSTAWFSNQFYLFHVRPGPISLATTFGVSVDFLSSGYLDVSVHQVCVFRRLYRAGFPHSDIHGSKLTCGSPWLFAACHVLHRLYSPRHSPNALQALERSTR